MIDAFLQARPSRSSLVLLAVISGLATAVILGDAFGASPVRQAVLAAARARAQTGRREVLVAEAALRSAQSAPAASVTAGSGASGGTGGDGGGSGGGSGSSGGPAAPSTPAPSNGPGPGPSPSPSPSASPSPPPSPAPAATPKATVAHLFEIVLSSSGYDATFGTHAAMPYLRSLTAHATELSQYRSLGHGALADELALVSGQPPNPDTSGGCSTYAEFPAGTAPNAAGVVTGDGCVYPETVLTLGDQISSAGHTWRAFVTGMGSQACVHPNSGAPDGAVLTGADPTYDTRQNPFIYFHSLLDLGDCSTGDLDLGKLPGALAARAHAPAYVYIAPGACEQATPSPGGATSSTSSSSTTSSPTTSSSTTTRPTTSSSTTTSPTTSSSTTSSTTSSPPGCPSGQPSGPAAQDTFLKTWVPKILASPAYRDRGALVIAFSAAAAAVRPVRTGALILTAARTHRRVVATPVDPYALLRGSETALGLTPLGEAKHASPAVAPLF